jgi:hypothetical protein
MSDELIEMCREISESVYNMVEGDDVCSEPIGDDERVRIQNLLGELLEDLMDPDEVECICNDGIYKIHGVLVEEGYI